VIDVPVVDYDPNEDGQDLTFCFRAGFRSPPMPQPGEWRVVYLWRCFREGWIPWQGDLLHLFKFHRK
jgi:hypothetical protein